jgi:membrane fusion protein (multidrug efflux system)
VRPRFLLAAIAAASLPACHDAATAPSSQAPAVPVEAVTVGTEDVDVNVRAVGSLKANQSVVLSSKLSGRVKELSIAEGQKVDIGQVLVVLEDDDLRARLDQARASLAETEARERNARRQYDRNKLLVQKGVASRQEYDDAEAEYESASAALAVARANVAFAEAQLADTVIRAPFEGLLGQRRVDIGAFVRDGAAIGSIVDLDPVEIVFAVPERHLSEIHVGQAVSTTVVSHSDRAFPGTVSFIDPEIDPVNRTITVKAVIRNPEFILRPGQFATVELQVARHPHMPVIPEEAVVPDGGRALVFVIHDGQAAPREIKTGVRLPGRVEVIEGLEPGERVVRIGHEKLPRDATTAVNAAASPEA